MIRSSVFRTLSTILLVLLSLPLFAGSISPEQRNKLLSEVNQYVTKSAFVPGVDFSKWPEFLKSQMPEIEKATTDSDFSAAVNKALSRFGASHIIFSTPEAVEQQVKGKVTGLGIAPEAVDGGVLINDVYQGSAAAEAGLESGDLILEVDGKKPVDIPSLRGTEGSVVRLLLKKSDGRQVAVSITRRAFSIQLPQTLTEVAPGIYCLRIPSFMSGYSREKVESLIKEASDKKARVLIVDLRSNGGGQVLNLLHLSGLIFPKGAPLGTFIDRSLVQMYVGETRGKPTDLKAIADWSDSHIKGFSPNIPRFEGKVIGLINGGSGSASEIFAAALRDILKAPLIGSKSAGAVLASVMQPLTGGFQLQYPFQDYVTVNGVRLEGAGVAPDIEVAARKSPKDEDPAIRAALDWLASQEGIVSAVK